MIYALLGRIWGPPSTSALEFETPQNLWTLSFFMTNSRTSEVLPQ
jgi:hypothetical protein